jgi:tight adherence protein C
VDVTVLLAAVGIFIAFGLFFVVVADWSTERGSLRRTLRGATASSAERVDVRGSQLAVPAISRLLVPAGQGAARLSRRLSPAGAYERVEQELVWAGNPRGWDAERIMAFKIVVPVVVGGAMLALGVLSDLDGGLILLGTVLFAAAGWYAPEWIVRSRAEERQHRIQLSLADSLDLMSITVQAGLAFDAALTRVSRNVKGPLGEELYRVVQEIQLGKSRSDALRDLADRTNVEDLRGFVASMVQAESFGIPIARVLQVQSREIRIRRRQRAEERAQKLPVKIVFPVVLTIFPAMFVVLLGPAAIEIYENLLRSGMGGG